MKSFRYAGGCLVRCPRSRGGGALTGRLSSGGGALTGGLLSSTGGVTGLLLTTGVSSSCSFLNSLDGAPPRGGFALPESKQVPEVVALDLALGAMSALLLR